MRVHRAVVVAVVILLSGACDGTGSGGGTEEPADTRGEQDHTAGVVRTYAGSASHGDLVVFSVDPEESSCQVINETTGQTTEHQYTLMEDEFEGIWNVQSSGDDFYAVELNDTLLAASFDTGNPQNTISFGVSGSTDNMVNQANLPGDYVYISISASPVNGSTDVKEWGLLSVIDDGTFRVKVQATGPGDETGPEALSPEEYVGVFPVEEPDVTGSWSVNPSDPVRLDVTLDQTGENLTGYAYAPDPNAIFVLDMGPGNGFLLAMKILPGITLANLAGTYKFINVWNDEAGEGRSAGKAIINGDGTGSFSHLDTTGEISTGQLGDITACPQIPNLFHATSVETGHGATVTLKHYFLLLPYAYLGFNFRTDGDFRFAGYSVGARLD